jgi:NADPH-dependent curcumin reductase CurA
MAIPTQGTTIGIAATAGAVGPFVTIGEATGWSGPRFTRNQIDVTHLLSTAKEFLAGLKDPGEFSIDVNFDLRDAGQEDAWDLLNSNAPVGVKVTFPDNAGGFTFDALVLNFETAGRADDKVTGTITLRITGDVTDVPPV